MIRELLSKQNIDFMERAREVAERHVRPIAAQHDVDQTYPWTFQKAIQDAGLSGVWIPKDYGGSGGTVLDLCLVVEQISRACGGMGVAYAVNALGSFPILLGGSEEQKARWLPGIAAGEKLIAFGLSEKDAGSDAGSMVTKAEKDGDHYIVNGSKTWNTMGHWADWIFCLVRTDSKAKPQEGISFLLIDMKTPGITVKPIIMADGGHEVNEVFFDNVKVPIANLVGKENEGWTCAKFLLANERLGIAAVPQSKRGVAALKDIARAEQEDGKPLIENQTFAEKIADLEIQVTALEFTELRVLSSMAHGGQPGPEVSGLKVRGSEIQQRITELTMEAVGEYAAPYLPGLLWQGSNEEPVGPAYAHQVAPRYFNTRKTTIYGGSNEIQKGIISKMVLGL